MVTEDQGQTDGNASFLRAARAGNLEKLLEYLKGSIDINTSNANGLNALHLASKEGHENVVAELLKRGANVNAATKKGNTALHIASLAGQEQVVKILVQNSANVNVQSQNGFTPLYMAAQENHDNVVRFLLSNGANQSLSTEDGFTPLAVALQQGHNKVVSVLLENDTIGKVRLPALHIAAKKDDCKAAALLLQNDHNPDVTSKSGFTPLHISAHYGNENMALVLLEKGADVNFLAKHQITPLHVASKWGKTNMVNLLIDKGAKIDAATRDGLTPLHCAARSGHDQVVDMLVEKGAPITAKTKNGLAPLHMAAQGDHVDCARILLYHKVPVDDVTVDYLTPLHVAAHCGHVRVAKLLLDRKADPNARALNGFTPLHIACKKNRMKVVELLLKLGASIEATTESGLTPLHVAAFMGCMNIVVFLIQNGTNPDIPTVRGETPLHLAARAHQTDIIRILLRNGAQVDARAREQQTPLHIAARLGNVDIVGLLLQHGAAVDATTNDMYTSLHIAAKEGQEEVASVLIEHGASTTVTTKKGFTPLHLAAKYGNIKVARLLLQKDAPVDAQGKNGVTPLHVAAHYDHVNVALLLLDKGASPHSTAKNGYTPLHVAAKKNQMDIATTLLEYGAKANVESKAGFTPLHLAAQAGHTDITTLLIEHQADVNAAAKNGLTPLHLCAQEDRVKVAAILVKNGAVIDPQTKAGYTPLHVASHFGQVNMVRFLLQHAATVNSTTTHGYTPLHQAAQQGHTFVVTLLLEGKASPNTVTNQGQTPLSIAQRLGYISVVESLKVVTETVTTTTTTVITEDKYKVVAPEIMQETFLSDSEDEGGDDFEETTLFGKPTHATHVYLPYYEGQKLQTREDTMAGDQSMRYMTADDMKFLGDDSLTIDVTKDEKPAENMVFNKHTGAPLTIQEEHLSPQYVNPNTEAFFVGNYAPDNIDISRAPVHSGKLKWKTFLVSFMVDARGGAMRGCRHSGVRVIIPPRKAPMPMRITCRYLRKEKLAHPPPLMEGEACASRILEVGPAGAKFLGPVILEVPHFASMRGKEREITVLRSDSGETWKEHVPPPDDAVHDVLNESFEGEEFSALEDLNTNRITRIVTMDFPQYFAIITRIRQEVHTIGPEGGMVSSTVVPQVQAIFPEGALTKKIKVGLQAQPIPPELVSKMLGNRVGVSPIVTIEPRRRKFHKPITLTIPVPQAASKGMINQYSGDAPTLRLLCSITGSTKSGATTKAQWEDVTGSTPLTFVNECVSFTTTVSARFWLMDCRQINEATKYATELYREAVNVPFMAKFVVFIKRHEPMEAQLRVFCMTDDKEDKTLENQKHFIEVAKSRDVEVLEGKSQYLEFVGNLVPVTKSGEQLTLMFQAFRENRLPFIVRVKDPHQEAVGRIAFMREPRVSRGDIPQTPICNLNIVLPDVCKAEGEYVDEIVTLERKYGYVQESGLARGGMLQRADLRLVDVAREIGSDWERLAFQLDIPEWDVNTIKNRYPDNVKSQSLMMLQLWAQKPTIQAKGNVLENALRKIARADVLNNCMFNVHIISDEVEKAVAKIQQDQSEFDNIRVELGRSREASLQREMSLDVSYDEQDLMKRLVDVEEAESAEETSSETGSVQEKQLPETRKTPPKDTQEKQKVAVTETPITREIASTKLPITEQIIVSHERISGEEELKKPTKTPPPTPVDKEQEGQQQVPDTDRKMYTTEKSQVLDDGTVKHSITTVTKETVVHDLSELPEELCKRVAELAEAEERHLGDKDGRQVTVTTIKEDGEAQPVVTTISSIGTSKTYPVEKHIVKEAQGADQKQVTSTVMTSRTFLGALNLTGKMDGKKTEKQILMLLDNEDQIEKEMKKTDTVLTSQAAIDKYGFKIDTSNTALTESQAVCLRDTGTSPIQTVSCTDRGISPIAVYAPRNVLFKGQPRPYAGTSELQIQGTLQFANELSETSQKQDSVTCEECPREILLDRKVFDTVDGRAISESKLTLSSFGTGRTLDIHFKTDSQIEISYHSDFSTPKPLAYHVGIGTDEELSEQGSTSLSHSLAESAVSPHKVKNISHILPGHIEQKMKTREIGTSASRNRISETFDAATSPIAGPTSEVAISTESPEKSDIASSPLLTESKSIGLSPMSDAGLEILKEDISAQTVSPGSLSVSTSPLVELDPGNLIKSSMEELNLSNLQDETNQYYSFDSDLELEAGIEPKKIDSDTTLKTSSLDIVSKTELPKETILQDSTGDNLMFSHFSDEISVSKPKEEIKETSEFLITNSVLDQQVKKELEKINETYSLNTTERIEYDLTVEKQLLEKSMRTNSQIISDVLFTSSLEKTSREEQEQKKTECETKVMESEIMKRKTEDAIEVGELQIESMKTETKTKVGEPKIDTEKIENKMGIKSPEKKLKERESQIKVNEVKVHSNKSDHEVNIDVTKIEPKKESDIKFKEPEADTKKKEPEMKVIELEVESKQTEPEEKIDKLEIKTKKAELDMKIKKSELELKKRESETTVIESKTDIRGRESVIKVGETETRSKKAEIKMEVDISEKESKEQESEIKVDNAEANANKSESEVKIEEAEIEPEIAEPDKKIRKSELKSRKKETEMKVGELEVEFKKKEPEGKICETKTEPEEADPDIKIRELELESKKTKTERKGKESKTEVKKKKPEIKVNVYGEELKSIEPEEKVEVEKVPKKAGPEMKVGESQVGLKKTETEEKIELMKEEADLKIREPELKSKKSEPGMEVEKSKLDSKEAEPEVKIEKLELESQNIDSEIIVEKPKLTSRKIESERKVKELEMKTKESGLAMKPVELEAKPKKTEFEIKVEEPEVSVNNIKFAPKSSESELSVIPVNKECEFQQIKPEIEQTVQDYEQDEKDKFVIRSGVLKCEMEFDFGLKSKELEKKHEAQQIEEISSVHVTEPERSKTFFKNIKREYFVTSDTSSSTEFDISEISETGMDIISEQHVEHEKVELKMAFTGKENKLFPGKEVQGDKLQTQQVGIRCLFIETPEELSKNLVTEVLIKESEEPNEQVFENEVLRSYEEIQEGNDRTGTILTAPNGEDYTESTNNRAITTVKDEKLSLFKEVKQTPKQPVESDTMLLNDVKFGNRKRSSILTPKMGDSAGNFQKETKVVYTENDLRIGTQEFAVETEEEAVDMKSQDVVTLEDICSALSDLPETDSLTSVTSTSSSLEMVTRQQVADTITCISSSAKEASLELESTQQEKIEFAMDHKRKEDDKQNHFLKQVYSEDSSDFQTFQKSASQNMVDFTLFSESLNHISESETTESSGSSVSTQREYYPLTIAGPSEPTIISGTDITEQTSSFQCKDLMDDYVNNNDKKLENFDTSNVSCIKTESQVSHSIFPGIQQSERDKIAEKFEETQEIPRTSSVEVTVHKEERVAENIESFCTAESVVGVSEEILDLDFSEEVLPNEETVMPTRERAEIVETFPMSFITYHVPSCYVGEEQRICKSDVLPESLILHGETNKDAFFDHKHFKEDEIDDSSEYLSERKNILHTFSPSYKEEIWEKKEAETSVVTSLKEWTETDEHGAVKRVMQNTSYVTSTTKQEAGVTPVKGDQSKSDVQENRTTQSILRPETFQRVLDPFEEGHEVTKVEENINTFFFKAETVASRSDLSPRIGDTSTVSGFRDFSNILIGNNETSVQESGAYKNGSNPEMITNQSDSSTRISDASTVSAEQNKSRVQESLASILVINPETVKDQSDSSTRISDASTVSAEQNESVVQESLASILVINPETVKDQSSLTTRISDASAVLAEQNESKFEESVASKSVINQETVKDQSDSSTRISDACIVSAEQNESRVQESLTSILVINPEMIKNQSDSSTRIGDANTVSDEQNESGVQESLASLLVINPEMIKDQSDSSTRISDASTVSAEQNESRIQENVVSRPIINPKTVKDESYSSTRISDASTVSAEQNESVVQESLASILVINPETVKDQSSLTTRISDASAVLAEQNESKFEESVASKSVINQETVKYQSDLSTRISDAFTVSDFIDFINVSVEHNESIVQESVAFKSVINPETVKDQSDSSTGIYDAFAVADIIDFNNISAEQNEFRSKKTIINSETVKDQSDSSTRTDNTSRLSSVVNYNFIPDDKSKSPVTENDVPNKDSNIPQHVTKCFNSFGETTDVCHVLNFSEKSDLLKTLTKPPGGSQSNMSTEKQLSEQVKKRKTNYSVESEYVEYPKTSNTSLEVQHADYKQMHEYDTTKSGTIEEFGMAEKEFRMIQEQLLSENVEENYVSIDSLTATCSTKKEIEESNKISIEDKKMDMPSVQTDYSQSEFKQINNHATHQEFSNTFKKLLKEKQNIPGEIKKIICDGKMICYYKSEKDPTSETESIYKLKSSVVPEVVQKNSSESNIKENFAVGDKLASGEKQQKPVIPVLTKEQLFEFGFPNLALEKKESLTLVEAERNKLHTSLTPKRFQVLELQEKKIPLSIGSDKKHQTTVASEVTKDTYRFQYLSLEEKQKQSQETEVTDKISTNLISHLTQNFSVEEKNNAPLVCSLQTFQRIAEAELPDDKNIGYKFQDLSLAAEKNVSPFIRKLQVSMIPEFTKCKPDSYDYKIQESPLAAEKMMSQKYPEVTKTSPFMHTLQESLTLENVIPRGIHSVQEMQKSNVIPMVMEEELPHYKSHKFPYMKEKQEPLKTNSFVQSPHRTSVHEQIQIQESQCSNRHYESSLMEEVEKQVSSLLREIDKESEITDYSKEQAWEKVDISINQAQEEVNLSEVEYQRIFSKEDTLMSDKGPVAYDSEFENDSSSVAATSEASVLDVETSSLPESLIEEQTVGTTKMKLLVRIREPGKEDIETLFTKDYIDKDKQDTFTRILIRPPNPTSEMKSQSTRSYIVTPEPCEDMERDRVNRTPASPVAFENSAFAGVDVIDAEGEGSCQVRSPYEVSPEKMEWPDAEKTLDSSSKSVYEQQLTGSGEDSDLRGSRLTTLSTRTITTQSTPTIVPSTGSHQISVSPPSQNVQEILGQLKNEGDSSHLVHPPAKDD
ncbi:LOW QUALITY PROTEIN: uncharacterized protein LOC143229504 [Tachypleus tridentatus]|uniref:LOW QUALITY PROTEIN: uncharacterized protein LOC143229504 n=1 Tax=Tachypleus tridentatus TaxID=6853 RepID=UPI003FCF03FA